jgi:hypothetical protein
MLTVDLHVHWFGCFTSNDLWEIGRDRWSQRETMLAWYAAEFAKVYGRAVEPRAYWTERGGRDKLARDFDICGPVTFPEFQAKFNLAIALCRPSDPSDLGPMELALRSYLAANRGKVQMRIRAPRDYNAEATADLVINLCQLVDRVAGVERCRLLISLDRNAAQLAWQWPTLLNLLKRNELARRVIAGVDFSEYEEGHPPQVMGMPIRQIAEGSSRVAELLGVMLHVGESFSEVGPEIGARWVAEAAALPVARLGHGLAAGVAARELVGRRYGFRHGDSIEHQSWLNANRELLQAAGFDFSHSQHRHGEAVPFTFDERDAHNLNLVQGVVCRELRERNAVVEVCPTSNLRIGGISTMAHHPVRRFVGEGVPFVIGTDDPGIMPTDLNGEGQLCLDIPLSKDVIDEAERRAKGLFC